MSEKKERSLLEEFSKEVDNDITGKTNGRASTDTATGEQADVMTPAQAFLRVPVLPQIYDILVYAHREHVESTKMLRIVMEAGFVSLFTSCLRSMII